MGGRAQKEGEKEEEWEGPRDTPPDPPLTPAKEPALRAKRRRRAGPPNPNFRPSSRDAALEPKGPSPASLPSGAALARPVSAGAGRAGDRAPLLLSRPGPAPAPPRFPAAHAPPLTPRAPLARGEGFGVEDRDVHVGVGGKSGEAPLAEGRVQDRKLRNLVRKVFKNFDGAGRP